MRRRCPVGSLVSYDPQLSTLKPSLFSVGRSFVSVNTPAFATQTLVRTQQKDIRRSFKSTPKAEAESKLALDGLLICFVVGL